MNIKNMAIRLTSFIMPIFSLFFAQSSSSFAFDRCSLEHPCAVNCIVGTKKNPGCADYSRFASPVNFLGTWKVFLYDVNNGNIVNKTSKEVSIEADGICKIDKGDAPCVWSQVGHSLEMKWPSFDTLLQGASAYPIDGEGVVALRGPVGRLKLVEVIGSGRRLTKDGLIHFWDGDRIR